MMLFFSSSSWMAAAPALPPLPPTTNTMSMPHRSICFTICLRAGRQRGAQRLGGMQVEADVTPCCRQHLPGSPAASRSPTAPAASPEPPAPAASPEPAAQPHDPCLRSAPPRLVPSMVPPSRWMPSTAFLVSTTGLALRS